MRKTGNHVCRADVCHKGRIGRMGFCRFLFWHWVKCTTSAKEAGARRVHGLALQSRWDGLGPPPLHRAPPLLGNVVLETTHHFHVKLCPGIMLGPKCNHDIGVLLRLPLLSAEQLHCDAARLRVELFPETRTATETFNDRGNGQEDIDAGTVVAISTAVKYLVDTIVDHEFYCVTYATKEPRALLWAQWFL